MKEDSAKQSAQLGYLVRNALAAFTTDHEAARRCLVDATALLESESVAVPHRAPTPSISIGRGSLAVWQAKRALAYIEANLESKIAIPEMAERFGVSKSHFSRAFKQSIGCPPMTYVCMRRVERVKQLMAARRSRLSDIALACGFADQSHLNRVFRRVMGVSPGAWRRHSDTVSP